MSNIQVVVRCRSRNSREIAAKSPLVIELPNDKYSISDPYITINTSYGTSNSNSQPTGNGSSTKQAASGSHSNTSGTSRRASSGTYNPISNFNNLKTYKVDQVYGSQADQRLIFEKVALPLFNDFMDGFNVTILAYGQTGTGKTYTMCGAQGGLTRPEQAVAKPKPSEDAGIIPRVLIELFEKLTDDYSVKCSFLELYNEELKDLLEDDAKPSKLRIYENVPAQTAGKKVAPKPVSKGIMIQNLTEEYISSCNDGLRVLNKGLNRRKTASTKLNDVSSRSHTIFTINLYRKTHSKARSSSPVMDVTSSSKLQRQTVSTPPAGEELFRVSKMNLVDLAGSENINRSGAINQRAKEAGSINQSLLTLGRVINSLSEANASGSNSNLSSTAHIPYRESKLTRLLQDSIGGGTKTTLIANISPAKINIEETVSTLDYASKAKSIKNIPQVGQDSDLIMKKVLVKNLSQEIVKLNCDLIATRNKNGIWLNEENYNNLNDENDSLKSSLKEASLRNEALTSKVAGLEDENFAKDDRIRDLEAQVALLNKENKTLSKDVAQNKLTIHDNNEQINSLGDQVSSLKDRFNSTTSKLTKIIYENLTKSISSIQTILQKLDHNQSSGDIGKISEQMVSNINKFKLELSRKVSQINENVTGSFLKDLPEFLNQYNENFSHLNDLIVTLNSNLINNLSNLKESNSKMSAYLANDHLSSQRSKEVVSQFLSETVNGQLSKLNEQYSKKLNSLIEESKSSYKSLFETSVSQISRDLIDHERSELKHHEQNWSKSSERILELINSDLKGCNTQSLKEQQVKFESLNRSTTTKLEQLNTKNVQSLSSLGAFIEKEDDESESILRKNLTERLNKINQSIAHNDSHISQTLQGIRKNLSEIKEFDTETAFKVSPIKLNRSSSFHEPIKSSIPSPRKVARPASVSPRRVSPTKSTLIGSGGIKTKIPQLNRDLENKENDGPMLKKRKVLESTVNIQNKDHISY